VWVAASGVGECLVGRGAKQWIIWLMAARRIIASDTVGPRWHPRARRRCAVSQAHSVRSTTRRRAMAAIPCWPFGVCEQCGRSCPLHAGPGRRVAGAAARGRTRTGSGWSGTSTAVRGLDAVTVVDARLDDAHRDESAKGVGDDGPFASAIFLPPPRWPPPARSASWPGRPVWPARAAVVTGSGESVERYRGGLSASPVT
jgi:hypothetical protein